MKLNVIGVTIVIAFLHATPASAQTDRGVHEVGVKGSFDRGNYEFETRTTRLNLDGYYGLFVSDHIELGPALTFTRDHGQDPTFAISGFTNIHLTNTSGMIVPYISVSYGQTFDDPRFGGDPTFVTAGPGLKWFFGDGGGALNLSAFYRRRVFGDRGSRNFASGTEEVGLAVGVAMFFGR